MTKALSSYSDKERPAVIARRLQRKAGGLGTLSAQDAVKRQGEVKKAEAEAEAAETENSGE